MQKIHFKAPNCWINDPNGFIWYQGQYHLFYQCFPYAPQWGRMHWGHAVSKDLVNWEEKGIALYPTKTDDRSGCFSGSAVEQDGTMVNAEGIGFAIPIDKGMKSVESIILNGDVKRPGLGVKVYEVDKEQAQANNLHSLGNRFRLRILRRSMAGADQHIIKAGRMAKLLSEEILPSPKRKGGRQKQKLFHVRLPLFSMPAAMASSSLEGRIRR